MNKLIPILMLIGIIFVSGCITEDKSIPENSPEPAPRVLEVPLFLTMKVAEHEHLQNPISDVSIDVYNREENFLFTETTDKNGLAKFQNSLTNGNNYIFLIHRNGYYSEVRDIALNYDIKPSIYNQVGSFSSNINIENEINWTITNLNYTLDEPIFLYKICNPEFGEYVKKEIRIRCDDGYIFDPFVEVRYRGTVLKTFDRDNSDVEEFQEQQHGYFIFSLNAIPVEDRQLERLEICIDDYKNYRLFRAMNYIDEGMPQTCIDYVNITGY